MLNELRNFNQELILCQSQKRRKHSQYFEHVIFHYKFTLWQIELSTCRKISFLFINSVYLVFSSLKRLIQIKVYNLLYLKQPTNFQKQELFKKLCMLNKQCLFGLLLSEKTHTNQSIQFTLSKTAHKLSKVATF